MQVFFAWKFDGLIFYTIKLPYKKTMQRKFRLPLKSDCYCAVLCKRYFNVDNVDLIKLLYL